jgi:pre-mRNA-processing factor 40
VAALSSYSIEQLEQAWTEYKPPDGRAAYYYNTLTGKSQWDKPPSIQRREALLTTSSTVVETQQAAKLHWNEFTDASTGKKYYSNGTTTTWEKPDDWKEESTQNPSTETVPEPPRKKKKATMRSNEATYGSKDESIAAFKGLLLAKEVSPAMKWNDVLKICSADSRWEACENVLSVGERKQALAEYQTKRTNELRDMERQEKVRAKEAFLRLLTDTLPAQPGFSSWTSRFEDVRDALSKDDRFHAVATEGTRESLFLDYCEESKKRDERKKRSKRKETHDNLLEFFKKKQDEGLLSFASTWMSFYAALSESDRLDPRLVTSSVMTDADRQLYFADYVIELQTVEDDKRSRIRVARRRAEQAQREAYEIALKELAHSGKVVPSCRWRDVEETISALPSYGPVHDQDREAPREIFEDFIAEWNEAYRWDRSILSRFVYPETGKPLVVTSDTSYDEFTGAILLSASIESPDVYSQVRRIINRSEPVSSACVYLQELILQNSSMNGGGSQRRAVSLHRDNESSSEDEGEIIET